MPVTVVVPGAGPGPAGPATLRCAFVNNMPDGAFLQTERQFLGLLEAGSGGIDIAVRCYTLAGVPRGERVTPEIAARYFPLVTLADSAPDIMIVTGSEPLAARIADEPYWDDLRGVLDVATTSCATVMLSCLAAHSALFAFEGIERTQLPAKCTGVYPQVAADGHPLVADLPAPAVMPHSRGNGVASERIVGAGYTVLMDSEVGWSLAAKRYGDCDVVLVQGHPEYDPTSLLREYRRDLERYLTDERRPLPPLPADCVAGDDLPALHALHAALPGSGRDRDLLPPFSFDDAVARAPWPWRPMAAALFANWLAGAAGRLPARRPATAGSQRSETSRA